jgi:hypothetical protein
LDQCVILVDNSNVFIGGRKLSALRRGLKPNGGHDEPVDPSWRLDFEALLACLAAGRRIHSALMVGSSRSEDDPVWESADEAGFDVVVHERRPGKGEKAVDTELVARGTEIITTAEAPMELVITSGDADYLPLVEVAHRWGWTVEMAAFDESFDNQGEMAKSVDRIRLLDECFDQIGRCSD